MRQFIPMQNIRLKRVYEQPSREDGTRILVDRLWPRGITKKEAHFDQWNREVAPSTRLRSWFGHDPERWAEFIRRYRSELSAQSNALDDVRRLARKGPITLLYAAKDEIHNHAVVLKSVLLETRAYHPVNENQRPRLPTGKHHADQ
jgi:uncharacterized protein YeaO (DUF488 family)